MFLAGNVVYIYYTFSHEELHNRWCTSSYFFYTSCVCLSLMFWVYFMFLDFPFTLCCVSNFIFTSISLKECSCSCLVLFCEYFVWVFFLFLCLASCETFCLAVTCHSTIPSENSWTSYKSSKSPFLFLLALYSPSPTSAALTSLIWSGWWASLTLS